LLLADQVQHDRELFHALGEGRHDLLELIAIGLSTLLKADR